ncbi:hypothetical protein MU633_22245, partial [Salmonella enterica subsp. enterica serovar Enteritidis]|nr:hypothetical protein [Salmonella enterica subsp. enterica serovar Enteritidis]
TDVTKHKPTVVACEKSRPYEERLFTIARSLYYKWLMLSSTHKTDLSILINQFFFHLFHVNNKT